MIPFATASAGSQSTEFSVTEETLCTMIYSHNSEIHHALSDALEAGHKATTFMVYAINCGNIDALKELLSYDKPDRPVAEAAGRAMSTEVFALLLSRDWDINQSIGFVPSLLSYAVSDLELLNYMLANGADPNAFSRMNETALSWAIRRGSMAVVKRLMDLTDLSRGDLLHCVVERETSPDTTELIASLVQQGLPVASYQWDNEVAGVFRHGALAGSALHLACTMGNMTAVRALLLHGADPQQPGKRIRTGSLDPSYTPLQIAERKSNVPLRTLLLERGTK